MFRFNKATLRSTIKMFAKSYLADPNSSVMPEHTPR